MMEDEKVYCLFGSERGVNVCPEAAEAMIKSKHNTPRIKPMCEDHAILLLHHRCTLLELL